MKQLNVITRIALVAAVLMVGTSLFVGGCSKSKDNKGEAKKNQPTKATKHTCVQMIDHIYPLLKAFRQSDTSAYGRLAKNMDESPATVKRRKANQVRTCEGRKYTFEEMHCYMTTKSAADIESCAAIWRERMKAAKAKPKAAEPKAAEPKTAEPKPTK